MNQLKLESDLLSMNYDKKKLNRLSLFKNFHNHKFCIKKSTIGIYWMNYVEPRCIVLCSILNSQFLYEETSLKPKIELFSDRHIKILQWRTTSTNKSSGAVIQLTTSSSMKRIYYAIACDRPCVKKRQKPCNSIYICVKVHLSAAIQSVPISIPSNRKLQPFFLFIRIHNTMSILQVQITIILLLTVCIAVAIKQSQ